MYFLAMKNIAISASSNIHGHFAGVATWSSPSTSATKWTQKMTWPSLNRNSRNMGSKGILSWMPPRNSSRNSTSLAFCEATVKRVRQVPTTIAVLRHLIGSTNRPYWQHYLFCYLFSLHWPPWWPQWVAPASQRLPCLWSISSERGYWKLARVKSPRNKTMRKKASTHCKVAGVEISCALHNLEQWSETWKWWFDVHAMCSSCTGKLCRALSNWSIAHYDKRHGKLKLTDIAPVSVL